MKMEGTSNNVVETMTCSEVVHLHLSAKITGDNFSHLSPFFLFFIKSHLPPFPLAISYRNINIDNLSLQKKREKNEYMSFMNKVQFM